MSESDEQPVASAARPSRWHRARPWVVAAVLALVCAGIVVVLPHVHAVSERARDAAAASSGRLALSADNQAAVLAARTEALNLLTYSRKNFDSDWSRALAGATGNLRKDVSAKKSATESALVKGKVDSKASIAQSAFESADEKGNVLVLVTVNAYRQSDSGERSVLAPQRLELTMVQSGGKWLATDLAMIGIQ